MNMLRKVLPLILLVVASAMANAADKVSGFVKGSPSGKTFVVGAKSGTFTVDASKARVTMKGKFFSIAKITGGSQVSVEGTKKGMTIMATSVSIGMLRGGAPAKAGMKPATKPGMKSKMPMKTTGKKPMAKKPGSSAKAKDNTKGKAPVKSKKGDKLKKGDKKKSGN
jgi:hypothetical protein